MTAAAVLYFAYGSNMDPEQMRDRCPGAQALGPARLRGHRLTFTRDSSRWQGGVASVEPDDSADVWGVLWDLEPRHVASLDVYESIAAGIYRKEECVVDAGGDERSALIYVANPTAGPPPSRRYVAALVRGATAFGLPDAYIDSIRTVCE